MTFVPHSRLLPRVLWRPAMFFFAAAQILLAFTPLVEGRGGSVGAHVENAGTTLHHGHNDADCIACVARALVSSSEHQRPGEIAPLSATLSFESRESVEPKAVWTAQSRSRAPPRRT